MIIDDRIYSTYEVSDPVAIELINSNLFQRLKNISQFGLPDKYYHKNGFSRYEHSIGVYILLDKLETSREEKIAGLLHDISHTAFSHLVDWVMGDTSKENYQDNRHSSVLQNREITDILKKYGFESERISNQKLFSLLERKLPYLCADRIDYSLREAGLDLANKIIEDFTVIDDRIVFSNRESALLFAQNFLSLQLNHWAGYEAVTRYSLFSRILKKALEKRDLEVKDFSKTDNYVINKLKSANNDEYDQVLFLLEEKDLSFLEEAKKPTYKKFRYVDPEVLVGEKVSCLSEINSNFKKNLIEAREQNEKGVFPGVKR